jgi:predicted dehydrogenase
VDISAEYLGAASALYDSVACYPDIDQALERHPDAEAVFIATPASLHHDLVRKALVANRHVWVEKPLTYDFGAARELERLSTDRGRAVVVGNQYQYHPLERRLQAIVRQGTYGRPFLVAYEHHRFRPEMRSFDGEYPALWEQGVHSLDSILAILGDARLQSVYALGQRPRHSSYKSDTVTNVLSRFANGVDAHLLVTFDSQRSDWSIRVECERAALLLRADGWDRNTIEIVAGEETIQTIHIDEAVHTNEPAEPVDPYSSFYREILSGAEAPTSIGRNVRTIEWIDAAVRSLRQGAVVRLD